MYRRLIVQERVFGAYFCSEPEVKRSLVNIHALLCLTVTVFAAGTEMAQHFNQDMVRRQLLFIYFIYLKLSVHICKTV